MVKMKLKVVFAFLVVLSFMSIISAWEFNGTVRDIDGNALNNTLINITIWKMGGPTGISFVGYNSTNSFVNGSFSLTVGENVTWMYKPIIIHTNETTSAVDWIGQSLPQFPYQEFLNLKNINFYLRAAGTINITSVNYTGVTKTFRYIVKDTALGYPIAEGFESDVSQAIIYVPRDRNYSIQIFPNQGMPVTYNWNNFSAISDYNISTPSNNINLSRYNATTHTLHKQFNSSENLIWVSGYIKNLTGQNLAGGWNEFTVVPFILEGGNMVYLGDNAAMPYNMSAWKNTCDFNTTINQTNAYINLTGYQLTPAGKYNYNITALWNATSSGAGSYNLSILLGNATVSSLGNVTNLTSSTWGNVSISYTYTSKCSDNYSLSTGFYNITLPGPAESASYILFATARNGTNYYGGYRNMSLNYTSESTPINFTMYPLMGTNWASSTSNITMKDATDWQNKNISSAKMQFNLVNSTTNATLSSAQAHIEVTVDYTNYNATEFTFMLDVSQTGAASFYLPLINSTGVKEINIYSQSFSPKTVTARTPAQLIANSNISMSTFNPGKIDGSNIKSSISVKMYKSNSTCNMPNPDDSCIIADSANMNTFNPLSSIIGGGKLNFVMGLLSSGIIVEYINVDMLASGPPDALFDDSTTNSTSGSFASAMRFGSNGPTIYDYVLISMPYTEGNTSTTGLNESADVNMSIPVFYDENWNIIWNATNNGTSGTNLAGNQSHYSTYATQWETLMGSKNCTRDKSELNSTKPCYIDTTNNRIWIRLPHFSGTQPSVTGSVVTATAATTTTTSSGSGRTSLVSEWAKQKIYSWAKITPGKVSIMKNFDKDIGIKEIQIEVNNPAQNVKITVRKYDSKPANVSVEKSGKVYKYLQIKTENLEDKLDKAIVTIEVEKNWTANNSITKENVTLFKFNENLKKWDELITNYTEEDLDNYYYDVELTSFSYFAISEKSIISGEETETTTTTTTTTPTSTTGDEEETNLTWLWILLIAVIVLLGIGYAIKKRGA